MVEVGPWVGWDVHTRVLLCKRSSENAQRELRDSVNRSLYADHARQMFVGLKK
jgi:hypothetical protein